MARLGAAISNSVTTIPLRDYIDPSELPQAGIILIGSEQIHYSNTTDRELIDCTRGYAGTSAATHAEGATVELVYTETSTGTSTKVVEVEDSYNADHSHQTVAVDLNLGSTVGDNTNTHYLAAVMGNLFGNLLTKTKNYLGGLIGAYSITGAKQTTYPSGAVLAQITDGVTACDGAVVAYIDGDSAQTKAGAAFTVRNNNSVPGSGFDYGVDLKGATHDGYPAVSYLVAEMRFSNGTKVTVSGDTIVFTNAAGNKSSTITMS